MSGDLPDGWVEVRLAEIAECQLGKMLDKAKQDRGQFLPYLRNVNVRWGSVDLGDLLQMPFDSREQVKFSIQDGDLLICEGGEPGRAAVWRHGPTSIKFQKALHRVRTADGVLPQLIAYRLRHDAATGTLADHLTGTTIKHLPGDVLARYPIPLPPAPEQHRIVEKVDELFARISRARAELAKVSGAVSSVAPSVRLLDRLEQAILEKAFAGTLVRQNPADEPASALLARIKASRESTPAAPRERRLSPRGASS